MEEPVLPQSQPKNSKVYAYLLNMDGNRKGESEGKGKKRERDKLGCTAY